MAATGRRYAQAAFELANEKDNLDVWVIDLTRASEILGDSDVLDFLDAPQVTDSVKLDGIGDLLAGVDPLVRNTVNLMTVNRDISKFAGMFRVFTEMADEHRSIARAEVVTAVPLDDARRVLDMGRTPMSLDRPIGESEDASFSELVEDFGSSSPTESTTHGLLRDKLDSLLKTLTYREREIIRLRYGLTDGYTYTLEEVGRIFRVTRERVRQIEAKAVKKLQHPVRAKQLENFLGTVAD